MGLFKFLYDLFRPPTAEEIGQAGEKQTGAELRRADRRGSKGLTLFNVYLPMSNGKDTEIDLLYITEIGIFVIENKNYKGWIFGTDSQKTWTEVLYTRKTWRNPKGSEKHHFYNPILQNNTHIYWLEKYLGKRIQMFSLSVFSRYCEFKDVDLSHSPSNIFVCHTKEVSSIIEKCFREYPKVLTEHQIEQIYNRLLPLTDVDFAKKEQHKQDVYDRKHGLVCPKCGGKLVIRTARAGRNSGEQFYGCSNYPKCKYTRNIRE